MSNLIFAQLPLLLSIRLLIVNVPIVPLAVQNDPNCKDEQPPQFTVDPIEYLLSESVFGLSGAT